MFKRKNTDKIFGFYKSGILIDESDFKGFLRWFPNTINLDDINKETKFTIGTNTYTLEELTNAIKINKNN